MHHSNMAAKVLLPLPCPSLAHGFSCSLPLSSPIDILLAHLCGDPGLEFPRKMQSSWLSPFLRFSAL
jgi:hypothetical protein